MSEQLPATLKNRYFWLLLLLGAFSLIMNANAIGAQIFYCNMVLKNPMFMSVLMTAGQLPGIFILFLMPAISKKWNKKTFLLMGAVLIIAGFAITGLAGEEYDNDRSWNCDPFIGGSSNPFGSVCTCSGCGRVWKLEIRHPFPKD